MGLLMWGTLSNKRLSLKLIVAARPRQRSLVSKAHRTQLIYSLKLETPRNLEGQVSVFISPSLMVSATADINPFYIYLHRLHGKYGILCFYTFIHFCGNTFTALLPGKSCLLIFHHSGFEPSSHNIGQLNNF